MAEPIDRAERLTNLLALLLSRRAALTFEQIFDELAGQYPEGAVARRQAFERDKASLRDIGVPIETEVLGGSEAGRTAYRIDRVRYELAELDLAPDERRALQLAVAASRSGTPIGTEALLKLGAGGADDESAVWANIPTLDVLPVLNGAISARAVVEFRYHGRDRAVEPWGLLLRDGFWYLVGLDRDHDEQRTFRVDRIEGGGVTVGTAGAFERPDVDVATLLPHDPKTLGAEPGCGAEAVVRLHRPTARVRSALAELGDDRVLRRHRDGGVDVRVAAANVPAVRSWVLGFVDDAEVLEPVELRRLVLDWLDAPVALDPEAVERAIAGSGSTAVPKASAVHAGRRRADERVRRMLVMLPWLAERGEVPLDEVAARFELSHDDVEADIAWVSLCGLPPYIDEMIDVSVDDGVVRVGVPRLFTRPLRLTAPEGFALLTAGRAAMALPGADPTGPLGRGLDKLAAVLGDDSAGVVVDLARPAIADDLADAVRRVERIALVYWSANRDDVTERTVTPRRLFTDRGNWYLTADDHRSEELRTFRLDRIDSYERLGAFDEPVEQGASSEWFSDASIARATLCLLPDAWWVAERYPVDEVLEASVGGRQVRLVRLAVVDERWLARLLVRLGPDAIVVEPATWRDVAEGARAAIRARYA